MFDSCTIYGTSRQKIEGVTRVYAKLCRKSIREWLVKLAETQDWRNYIIFDWTMELDDEVKEWAKDCLMRRKSFQN